MAAGADHALCCVAALRPHQSAAARVEASETDISRSDQHLRIMWLTRPGPVLQVCKADALEELVRHRVLNSAIEQATAEGNAPLADAGHKVGSATLKYRIRLTVTVNFQGWAQGRDSNGVG